MLAICGAAYALNLWLLQMVAPFFRDHFNDVLAGAILLAYANAITPQGTVVARYVASIPGAVAIIGFGGLIWEGLAPRLLSNSTGDLLDIVAYAVGGGAYQIAAVIHDQRANSRLKPV